MAGWRTGNPTGAYFVRRDSKAPLSSGDARVLFPSGAIGCQAVSPSGGEIAGACQQESRAGSGHAISIQIDDLGFRLFTRLPAGKKTSNIRGDLVGLDQTPDLQPRL
jgi:hypothetical protein